MEEHKRIVFYTYSTNIYISSLKVNIMTHAEFKSAARQHQIDFKVNDPEINVPTDRFLVRTLRKNGREYRIDVESSLRWEDCRDANGDYRIFFSGFRHEITEAVNGRMFSTKGQMVTNLLRSEHIPYNIFYPMQHDKEGAAHLFNSIMGENKIAEINNIEIEYNPGGLKDGTSFDVYVEYTPLDCKYGEKGGIGIEVKYTEKEYPVQRGSKEWEETHNASGIHLADNYRIPSKESGWFKDKFIADVPFADEKKLTVHVAANRYRQIWRNHILGASMLLGLCPREDDKLSEFTSLTVYPQGNGHFSDVWASYESMLTSSGLATFRHLTYEELFPLMHDLLDGNKIPNLSEWINYLNRRYIVSKQTEAR